jgi:hypothetical protein
LELKKKQRASGRFYATSASRDAKDCHPMVQATMDAAVRLSGTENAMKAKEAITRATLPIEDENTLADYEGRC